MRLFLVFTLASFLVAAGCVSTEMYTYDGFLTEYGAEQTDIERAAVVSECQATYEYRSSKRYTCYRQVVPLMSRLDPTFGDLYMTYLTSALNIAEGAEAGNISQETASAAIDEYFDEYEFQHSLLMEQFNRIVNTRNAQEKYAARQQMGMALNQVGSELLKQSSTGKSVTCTETAPGTVSCSEW